MVVWGVVKTYCSPGIVRILPTCVSRKFIYYKNLAIRIEIHYRIIKEAHRNGTGKRNLGD